MRDNSNATTDLTAELAAVQAQRKRKRFRRYRSSRLDPHRVALLELRAQGASLRDLVAWLRSRRIRVHHSTVDRFLKKHGGAHPDA